MTSSHETIRDDLAAYALGSLDPEDARAVEQHLEQCRECRQILIEYDEVLRLLPFGLPMAVPSGGARAALVACARSGGDPRHRISRTWDWLRQYRYTALAVASVLVLLLAISLNQLMQDSDTDAPAEFVAALRNHPEAQIIPMAGTAPAPDAVGQLILQPGQPRAGLVVSGLPELPAGQVYQFWSIRPDKTYVGGGVFEPDGQGEAVVVQVPSDYGWGWGCSVTIEPSVGSSTPTGQVVLRGWYEDEW